MKHITFLNSAFRKLFTFPIWKRSQELSPYEKYESYFTKPAFQEGKLFYVRKKKPEQFTSISRGSENNSNKDDLETHKTKSQGKIFLI